MLAPRGTVISVFQDGEFVKKIEVKKDQQSSILENDKARHHLHRIQIGKPGFRVFTFTFG